LAEVIKRQRN